MLKSVMIDQETRELALQTFRDTLKSANSTGAEKLRAAESIMRLEAEQKGPANSDVLEGTDEELLEIARGAKPQDEIDEATRHAAGE